MENKYKSGLRVITLGNFDVIDDGCSLTEKYSSSLKLWELFKFLITYRDELILPEKIIDSIWPESDYQDPNRTLRALVFRLRKILSEHSGRDGKDIIVHSHGCYKLCTEEFDYIDMVELEKLFKEAIDITMENPAKAIGLYYSIIDMHKNGYLIQSHEYEWLVPARNCYRRIFLQSIIGISDLLKKQKEYQKVMIICQNALKYEMLEERIHCEYIEALGEMGLINQVKNHYDYVVDMFEQDLGVKPSKELSGLYRVICQDFDKVGNETDSMLSEIACSVAPDGAILCDPEFFKLQCQLERRRFERDGKPSILALLTMSLPDCSAPSDEMLNNAIPKLKNIIVTTLRKGDIVAQWNKMQFIMNLPGTNDQQANIAIRRISRKFMVLEESKSLILHIKTEEVRE